MQECLDVLLFMRSVGGGGAERVAVNIANQLAEEGLKCGFVVMGKERDYQKEIRHDISLHFLNTPRYSVAGMRVVSYLRRFRPRVIFSTNHRTSFWGVMAKRFSKVPARVIVREPTTPSQMLLELTNFKERATTIPMMRWAYHRADGVVAPSYGVRDDLVRTLGLKPERITVIYNPVITQSMERLKLEPVAHSWFEEEGTPIILAVGRLAYPKNYPLLIRAFALVREQLSARLLILGEGELRAEIEQLVAQLGLSEWVSMPGFDPNPFRYMARADVLALTSVREGFPNVLVQAMACGCPVVSTDCPSGPREILDGGKYGYLVPVNDEEALAEALLCTLKGEVKPVPPEWLEQFRAEKIGEQYLNLLLPER